MDALFYCLLYSTLQFIPQVWLGRQTLDKGSTTTGGSTARSSSQQQQVAGRLQHTVELQQHGLPRRGPEYGFVRRQPRPRLQAAPDLYAELPRRRRAEESPEPSVVYSNQPAGSPAPSLLSRPSLAVDSATYTRRRPVEPSRDILPVGFPVLCSDTPGSNCGFQNPWEALQLAGAGEHQFFQDCSRDRGEPGRRLVLELDQQVTYSVSH